MRDGKIELLCGDHATRIFARANRIWIICIFFQITDCSASALDHWTWVNPLPSGHLRYAFAKNGERIVGVGDGTAIVSSNALDWTVVEISPGQRSPHLSTIAYGNGGFVAMSWYETWKSTDGVTWSFVRALGGFKVIYAAGAFYSVGEEGIFSSSDGVTWNRQLSPQVSRFTDIAHGDGTFVAVGNFPGLGILFTSPDGVNWSQQLYTSELLNRVTFGNGRFLAYGELEGNPVCMASVDGAAWDQVETDYRPDAILFENGLFIGAGYGVIATSADGTSWLRRESNAPVFSLGSFNGRYVAGGMILMVSEDAENWRPHQVITTARLRTFAAGPETLVFTGDESSILSSRGDGLWSSNSLPRDAKITAVTYGNGRFVGIGDSAKGHRYFESINGIEWGDHSSFTGGLRDIAFGEGVFVAVGSDLNERASVRRFLTRFEWSIPAVPNASPLTQVRFGGGKFVAAGRDGVILVSDDSGISWTERRLPIAMSPSGLAFGNDVFVAIDYGGNVASSADGASWTLLRESRPFPSSDDPKEIIDLAFGDGRFVALYENGIYSSDDGTAWKRTRITDALYANFETIGFANSRFYVGGQYGSLLQSSYTGKPRIVEATGTPVEAALTILAEPDRPYVIEGSDAIEAIDWEVYGPYTFDSERNVFKLNAPGRSNRFYRARVAP